MNTGAIETTAMLGVATSPARPSLLERHFRAKLTRMYAKDAQRKQRAPIALAKAEAKRQRKAEKRKVC